MLKLVSHDDVVRIHMWTRRSRAAGYSVSAFLSRGVLIDTGFPDSGGELAAYLDTARPRGVVVTHQHEDHAGNIELLARRGLPIAAAPGTLDAVRLGEPHVGRYRRFCWGSMRPLASAVAPFEPHEFELIATPGHSPDHHIVWDAERETMFAGDLFLGVKVRVARPMENPRELAQSVRAAAALRPRIVFDAHRGKLADATSSLSAKADWLDETIGAIDDRIARGWEDRAIALSVLGREDLAYYFSLGDLSRINFVRAVRATAKPLALEAVESSPAAP